MKFIDLKDMIHAETRDQVYLDEVGEVLDWLDEHPDQVPGRTITEGEVERLFDMTRTATSDERLHEIGLTIVDDPEPTNAELLAIYLGLHDLDAITQAGVADFARQLDADGIKAPGVSES